MIYQQIKSLWVTTNHTECVEKTKIYYSLTCHQGPIQIFRLHPRPEIEYLSISWNIWAFHHLVLICSREKLFQCSNPNVAPSERSSTFPSIWMNSSTRGDFFFLHQGCPCLSFPSIAAAFAEIAIKITTPRFALFSGVRNLNERTLLQRASSVLTDRLTWLTACDLFRVIFGLSLFLDVSFACPTYCIPQSELEAFFSLIQIFLSICSPFILHFSHFSSGFSAICSCLWHLLYLPFHSSHIDSAFYPSTLFSTFPYAFPLFVLPQWQILWLSF